MSIRMFEVAVVNTENLFRSLYVLKQNTLELMLDKLHMLALNTIVRK